jgi:subtilisin family serine protease
MLLKGPNSKGKKQENDMKTTALRRKNNFSWLLAVSVVTVFLFSLAFPAGSVQASPPGVPYIIVFKTTVNPAAEAPGLANAYGLQPGFIYQHALKGMSAVVPEGRLEALQHDPRVAYVVEDMERSINAQSMPTGIQRIFADTNPAIAINGADDYRVDVDVAVIDTGVDFQHPDLNVAGGVNCYNWWPFSASCKSGGDDDHYHGTHVAGTIGAIDNGIGVVGVAPGARIWAVKVLSASGSGYSSQIIAGIDWVTAHASTIEVANMSLGGSGFSQAEYDAIQGAVNAGIAFAVAAGNDDADANNYSPGGFDNVLSVSALADFNGLPGGGGAPTCRADQDDTLADFSNWGAEIDVAAPGVCILSTYPIEQGEYGTISGTSMASPHAAGALALLASANNPANATDVYNLYNQVKAAGNYNWTDDSGDGIQEPLLDVSTFTPLLVPGTGGTPPAAPANLIATSVSSSQINLTWTDSDNTETGFKVERCTGVGCSDFAQIATVAANAIIYSDTGLTASTSYTYRVSAYNTAGDSDYSNTASAVTQAAAVVPAAPTNLVATAVSKSQINLTWTDNAGNEDGFRIERCKGATCTNFSQIATVGPDVTAFANTGLAANTSYRYRVRAYNASGTSGYSNIATAKTLRR